MTSLTQPGETLRLLQDVENKTQAFGAMYESAEETERNTEAAVGESQALPRIDWVQQVQR